MPSTCTGWPAARGGASSGSPAPTGPTCGRRACARETRSPLPSLLGGSSESLLFLQIVESQRVLSEDFRLHARLEILALQELVDRVRRLTVPVGRGRGGANVVLARQA